MRKDLFTFLVSSEAPAETLKAEVKKDIQLSFRKNQILLKFIGYQILGAVFSLSFCPQFGLGMNPGIDISHFFMRFGMWACASFCGSLFLSTGLIVAMLGMKGEELWWVWRRYKFPVIFMPATLWSVLMLTNTTLSLPKEDLSFNLFWIFSATLSLGAILSLRGRIYSSFQIRT